MDLYLYSLTCLHGILFNKEQGQLYLSRFWVHTILLLQIKVFWYECHVDQYIKIY